MAAATFIMGGIFGTVAVLNYDDATLLASSIVFDSTNGRRQVSLDVNVSGGQHQSLTASPGISATMTFSPQIAVVVTQHKGQNRVTITNATFTMQGVAS